MDGFSLFLNSAYRFWELLSFGEKKLNKKVYNRNYLKTYLRRFNTIAVRIVVRTF